MNKSAERKNCQGSKKKKSTKTHPCYPLFPGFSKDYLLLQLFESLSLFRLSAPNENQHIIILIISSGGSGEAELCSVFVYLIAAGGAFRGPRWH